jgi:hypothetical protein
MPSDLPGCGRWSVGPSVWVLSVENRATGGQFSAFSFVGLPTRMSATGPALSGRGGVASSPSAP